MGNTQSQTTINQLNNQLVVSENDIKVHSEDINNFISNSINKYPTLKIRQYSGSVPENILDPDSKKQVVKWCLIPGPIKSLLLPYFF